jgi:hypothetical protein
MEEKRKEERKGERKTKVRNERKKERKKEWKCGIYSYTWIHHLRIFLIYYSRLLNIDRCNLMKNNNKKKIHKDGRNQVTKGHKWRAQNMWWGGSFIQLWT